LKIIVSNGYENYLPTPKAKKCPARFNRSWMIQVSSFSENVVPWKVRRVHAVGSPGKENEDLKEERNAHIHDH
jgi:hypothetical protein